MSALVTAAAAATMGVAGSVHCIAMCGPLSAALCPELGRAPRVHAGRLVSYAALGALAGGVGAASEVLLPLAAVQTASRVFAALVLLVMGLSLAGILRGRGAGFGPVGALSARLAKARGALTAGLLWGLIPCGLVYGAVALAATSRSPSGGALTMLAFWAGTLPSLGVTRLAIAHGKRFASMPRVRQTAGLVLVLSGAVQLAMLQVERQTAAPQPACCAGEAPAHLSSD